jgi:hypothetical protein
LRTWLASGSKESKPNLKAVRHSHFVQLLLLNMGGNLEIFKFGMYLFVPVFALLHFGDPAWYHDNVLPVRAAVYLINPY